MVGLRRTRRRIRLTTGPITHGCYSSICCRTLNKRPSTRDGTSTPTMPPLPIRQRVSLTLSNTENWAYPAGRITVEVSCVTVMNCRNGDEIYSFHYDACNFALADGSVMAIKTHVKFKTFQALFTPDNSDIPGDEWY